MTSATSLESLIVAKKWTVRDRHGNEIYLTEERWDHIRTYHPALRDHLEDVLNTLRSGQRKQKPLTPNEYKYFKRCDTLPPHYNAIIVVVAFTWQKQDGVVVPNNFVKTAWEVYVHRLDRW